MAGLRHSLRRGASLSASLTSLGYRARNQGGGGGGVSWLAIHVWQQSNAVGAHRVATGGSLSSPADDAIPEGWQYSPQGGSAAGDPAKARILLPATGHLLFTSGVSPDIDVAVTPAFSYMKALVAAGALAPGQKFVIFPFGAGGRSMRDFMDYSLVGGQPQGPSSTQPLFEDAKATWAQWLSEHPDTVVHSILYSPTENEMLEGLSPADTAQRFDLEFLSHRNLPLCSNAPIGLWTPTPEFVVTDPYKLIYNEIGRAAVRHPNVFTFHTAPGGSVGGDQVHATNTAQRNDRGPKLKLAFDAFPSFQNVAPPQVTVHGLVAQTLTFTLVGAPKYIIQTSAPGANAWGGDFEPTILQDNRAGQSFTMTLPGSGSRDYRILAVSHGGTSISTTGNYTSPSVTVPTPLVELDFENATVDGSGNIISVPSIGTDTTPWVPHSSSGTGAAALMKFELVNGKRVLTLDHASKRLHYAGTLPAGNLSGVLPQYYGGLPSNGVLLGWGQATTLGDAFLTHANSGANIRMGFTNTTSQVISTSNPFTGKTGKYMSVDFTYDRTANALRLGVNDAAVITGTPTQRVASPNNSGGTQLYGYNTDATANGLSNAKALPPKIWNGVLTADQIAVVNAAYAATFGITFG